MKEILTRIGILLICFGLVKLVLAMILRRKEKTSETCGDSSSRAASRPKRLETSGLSRRIRPHPLTSGSNLENTRTGESQAPSRRNNPPAFLYR